MRVFITGVTGQVGRAIAAHLAAQGCRVNGISRHSRPVPGLSQHVEACFGSEDAVNRIQQALKPCEAIVHAAACMSHDNNDPSISLTNCLGTQQVLKLGESWGAAQLVFISSIQVIGVLRHPISEDYPTEPATAYHASKLYGEHLMRLVENSGRRAASLRLTSPSGPGTPENRILSVFAVERRLVSRCMVWPGNRRQNYVDVRDVACG